MKSICFQKCRSRFLHISRGENRRHFTRQPAVGAINANSLAISEENQLSRRWAGNFARSCSVFFVWTRGWCGQLPGCWSCTMTSLWRWSTGQLMFYITRVDRRRLRPPNAGWHAGCPFQWIEQKNTTADVAGRGRRLACFLIGGDIESGRSFDGSCIEPSHDGGCLLRCAAIVLCIALCIAVTATRI